MSLHCWSVVNGYTALFAENQLDWLGVTKSSAKAGLRSLLEQFLIGAKHKSAPKDLNFQLFKDAKSLEYLHLMETMSQEID